MPNEESYLNESLRKIAKGAGIGFTGAFIGMAFGYSPSVTLDEFMEIESRMHSNPKNRSKKPCP